MLLISRKLLSSRKPIGRKLTFPKTNLPENTHSRNTRKCISENLRSRQWIPRNQIGYIWSSTSHQYKHNAPNIQISSPPFDVRFVNPVLNYRIVRIVNSSISTQPATLQQLIVMTKSRKYDEFNVWKPKAHQHHRSDPDTIRNHRIVMSNSMETQSVSAPPKWPRHYQKPMKFFVWHRNNTCI